MKLFSRSKRVISVNPDLILNGHTIVDGQKSGQIFPEQVVEVKEELGKKLLKCYPREFRNLDTEERKVITSTTESTQSLVPNPGSLGETNPPAPTQAEILDDAKKAIGAMNFEQLAEYEENVKGSKHTDEVKAELLKLCSARLAELGEKE